MLHARPSRVFFNWLILWSVRCLRHLAVPGCVFSGFRRDPGEGICSAVLWWILRLLSPGGRHEGRYILRHMSSSDGPWNCVEKGW